MLILIIKRMKLNGFRNKNLDEHNNDKTIIKALKIDINKILLIFN